MIKGLDVSHYNSDPPYEKINFKKVKAAGYDFVIIKATQGTWMVDDFLEYNAKAAPDADLKTGLFHFLDPYDESGDNQYDYFMENTDGLHGELQDSLDVEWKGELTNAKLTSMVLEFLVKPPVIPKWLLYSNLNFLDNILTNPDEIADVADLWLAWPSETATYPRLPRHYPESILKLWQKSWTRKVDGIKDPTNDEDVVIDEAWYGTGGISNPIYQVSVPSDTKDFTIEVHRT